jgi:hypothetical protein
VSAPPTRANTKTDLTQKPFLRRVEYRELEAGYEPRLLFI